MYYTRSETEDNKGSGTMIVVSNRSGGAWGAPSTITLFKDSTVSVAHPAISTRRRDALFCIGRTRRNGR